MRILIDPDRPDILVAQPRNPAALGAIAMAAFGCVSLIGGAKCLLSQPNTYHIYGYVLVGLGTPSFFFGCLALFRRTRFFLDRTNKTASMERKGLLNSRRTTYSVDAVILVRYWIFNRMARAESDFRFRLRLHSSSARLELGSKLSEAEATEAATTIAAFLELPLRTEEGRVEGVVAGR